MLPTDVFCRCAIFPNVLKQGEDRFDSSALLAFSGCRGSASQILSLAGWDKCCDDSSVHEYGESVASTKNDRRAVESELNESKDTAFSYYLGFYRFNATKLDFTQLMYSKHDLRHAPEDGDDRHYQLELNPLNDGIKDRQVKSDMRVIRTAIADIMKGPSLLPAERCTDHQLDLQSKFMPSFG